MTLIHALDPVDEFLVDNQLVEGLLAFGDIAVLYGAAKTGKSFLAVDLALALSNGEIWCDRSINTAKVLYWAGEDFNGLIARRAACMRHAREASPVLLHRATESRRGCPTKLRAGSDE